MHTLNHLIIGVLAAWVFHLPLPLATLFILASILIDIDHMTELKILDKCTLDKRGVYNLKAYKDVCYGKGQKSMHLFHTVEFMAILGILSFFFVPLFWIWVAFAIHLLTDAWGNILNRNIGERGTRD